MVSEKTWLLDYRTHNYGDAIFRGMMRESNGPVEHIRPGLNDAADPIAFQCEHLEEAVEEGIGQVVVIPARDSGQLWQAMQTATRDGVFLISIDTKPIRREFVHNRVAPPRFICARYDVTGDLIATTCVTHLRADKQSRAILWTGPESSWAGEERSRRIVYALASAGLFDRVGLVPLRSWEADTARCEATVRLLRDHTASTTVVYTADDENALALHKHVMNSEPTLREKMLIIGCNATPDAADTVPALQSGALDVTIDLSIVNQGRRAAKMVNRYRDGAPNVAETVYLEPSIMWRADSPFNSHGIEASGSARAGSSARQYGGVGAGEDW